MPAAQPRDIDRLFQALGSPVRRQVLERLSHGAATVSDLAEPFTMALPSFVQHLRVLERGGLVRSEKRGRTRTYRIAPEGFAPVELWLERQRRVWERRLDQLDSYLETLKAQEENP